LVALIGVIVMVGLGREGSLLGDLLAFGMTVGMAVMMVMARRYPSIPVLQAACLSALLSGLLAWPFGAPTMISSAEFGLLAAFGLVNSALGLTLFTMGARRLPAIETGLIGALDAPLAPLWVWLAFGEVPGKTTLIGGTIVFSAVAAHIVLSSRSAATNSLGDRR
jgi:drug/metabolite transporter (DMT)-like permease